MDNRLVGLGLCAAFVIHCEPRPPRVADVDAFCEPLEALTLSGRYLVESGPGGSESVTKEALIHSLAFRAATETFDGTHLYEGVPVVIEVAGGVPPGERASSKSGETEDDGSISGLCPEPDRERSVTSDVDAARVLAVCVSQDCGASNEWEFSAESQTTVSGEGGIVTFSVLVGYDVAGAVILSMGNAACVIPVASARAEAEG